MKNIVISAFRQFGDYAANASEIVARRLDRTTFSGYEIHSQIYQSTIPTYNRGRDLMEMARKLEAPGIISLGMASGVRGLTVEHRAENRVYNTKYCTRNQNGSYVDRHWPYAEIFDLNLTDWNPGRFFRYCLEKNIRMDFSLSAGTFCCNHLMFQVRALQMFERTQYFNQNFIFIHIPCCPEAVPGDREEFEAEGKVVMETDEVIRGLQILLENADLGKPK